jgi:hypothetical protein
MMRATRVVTVAVVCGAILAVGFVAAPEPLPALELVTPASTPVTGTQEATP